MGCGGSKATEEKRGPNNEAAHSAAPQDAGFAGQQTAQQQQQQSNGSGSALPPPPNASSSSQQSSTTPQPPAALPNITNFHRKVIAGTSQTLIDNAVLFRTAVETVQPTGYYGTPKAMMADDTPLRTLYSQNIRQPMPTQLEGAAATSFAQMINAMRTHGQGECARAVLEACAQRGDVLDAAAQAKLSRDAAAEATKAITQMTEQYISSIFERSVATVVGGGSATMDAPNRNAVRRSPRASPSNKGAEGGSPAVVLPPGRWVRAEGSPFYWSDQEKLFYHPESTQFYDPETNKWYDPDADEWYDEDEDEAETHQ